MRPRGSRSEAGKTFLVDIDVPGRFEPRAPALNQLSRSGTTLNDPSVSSVTLSHVSQCGHAVLSQRGLDLFARHALGAHASPPG
jgi:hypothetical protein